MKELTTVSGNILFSENREGDKLQHRRLTEN